MWPTTGLVGTMNMPEACATAWDSGVSIDLSIARSASYRSSSAHTTSSNTALPARSPSPQTVEVTSVQPAATAARVFAVPSP